MSAYDNPTGWVVVFHRGMATSLYFGPFASFAEARTWRATHLDGSGVIAPTFLDVNWCR